MRPAIPLLLTGALSLAAYTVFRTPDIPFVKHTISEGVSESAAVCDINGDAKLDIVSGEYWYEAPSWRPHHFRSIPYTNNYIDDLSTLPLDVDGDGRIDLVTSGWFTKRLAWWRNPGKSSATAQWKENPVETSSPIEFSFLVDLDNDGKSNEILPQFGDEKAPLAWYERNKGTLIKHTVASKSYGHGIGVGDVNGDGRNDILTPQGWLEAPSGPRASSWKMHADWNIKESLGFMFVKDVNSDGKADIVSSNAHNYGIFWMERKDDGSWTQHTIDDSWSQAHAVTLIDFRGKNNLGLLTGKRYMAHNGKDPGEREPLGIYWYERLIDPETKKIEWARHLIDYGTRAGGGIQIPVIDIDRDGDLDFVVAGKSGAYLFENKTK